MTLKVSSLVHDCIGGSVYVDSTHLQWKAEIAGFKFNGGIALAGSDTASVVAALGEFITETARLREVMEAMTFVEAAAYKRAIDALDGIKIDHANGVITDSHYADLKSDLEDVRDRLKYDAERRIKDFKAHAA